MSRDSTQDPPPGDTLVPGDRYHVQHRLGGGGMADVYLAEDTRLRRLVALKVLKEQFAGDAEFVERFRVEAQASAQLSHPNIVTVYDRAAQGPPWYIAMEYVPGETLKQRVRREGPLGPDEAVRITLAVLAALQAAHQQHIVHRDVTPANVLVDPAGRVKVADFGIARIGASALTRTGTMMGTSSYLSPEQAQGRPADERSDLYSLGAVLFELLTGRVPFVADSDVAVALQHVNEPAPDPRSLRPDLPPALAAVVLQALAKDPQRRFQSAARFAAALRAALPGARPAASIVSAAEALLPATGPSPAAAAAATVAVTQGGATARTVYRSERHAALDGHGAAAPLTAAPQTAALTRLAPEPATTVQAPRRRRRRWLLISVAVVLAAAAAAWAVLALTADRGVGVPDVVGGHAAAAAGAVRQRGLRPVLHREYNDHYALGLVTRQLPRAGRRVPAKTHVDLWVSRGPLHIPAPDLSGLSAAAATAGLGRADLVAVGHHSATRKVPAGQVYRQQPGAGTTVARGDAVEYWVSIGPPHVKVPDVVGLSSGDAGAALQRRGLVVNRQYVAGFGSVPGEVVGQDPSAGVRARSGDQVTIKIAVL